MWHRRDYDQYLGFDFLEGKPLAEEQVTQALKYLQLVSKAVYLALQTPDNKIESIEVMEIDQSLQGTIHGVEGQDPLLREFPFQLKVRGSSLNDITWLVHQLSVDRKATPRQKEYTEWLNTEITEKIRQAIPFARLQQSTNTGNVNTPLIVKDILISSENTDPESG